MQDIAARVRAYIDDNFLMGTDAVRLAEDDSFLERHIIDSTGFLELIAFLEETFHITVEEEEMLPENLDSLRAIAAFVARKRQG